MVLEGYERVCASAAREATTLDGTIRVTAPSFFGRLCVTPIVIAFVERHPAIRPELDLSDRKLSLHDEGFDVAVRVGGVADPSLKVRTVARVRRLIVASPEYISKKGVPHCAEDLAGHDVIHYGAPSESYWTVNDRTGRPVVVRSVPRFTVNQADAKLAAARAGCGLITALSYQVLDDLASGRLVRVLPDFEPELVPIQLTWIEGREQLPRVRSFIDHLAEGLGTAPATQWSDG
jgi:DNA-binding transcriptional LysR family regulator